MDNYPDNIDDYTCKGCGELNPCCECEEEEEDDDRGDYDRDNERDYE